MKIEFLIDAFQQAGLQPTAEEIADTVYLAGRMAVCGYQRTGKENNIEVEEGLAPTKTSPASNYQKESKKGARVFPLPSLEDEVNPDLRNRLIKTGAQVYPIRVPAGKALPGAIEMECGLRPFKQRTPSRFRFAMDEEATVDEIAAGGFWLPVMQPTQERWLDVLVVVDAWATMVAWADMVSEFCQMLERTAAFRSVQVWSFTTRQEGDGRCSVALQNGLDFSSDHPRSDPCCLIDPAGQRQILILSDGLSPAWDDWNNLQENSLAYMLNCWGKTGPLAMVQTLPEYMWRRYSFHSAVPAWLHSHAPAEANYGLVCEPISWLYAGEPITGLPLPVVNLDSDSISTWACWATGEGTGVIRGLVLPIGRKATARDGEHPEVNQERGFTKTEPDLLFDQFWRTASQTTRQLAGFLAAAPLNLAVMRLVQEVMLPESRQWHMAEFMISGLIQAVAGSIHLSAAHDIWYKFVDPDMRGRLLKKTMPAKQLEVLALVYRRVSLHVNRNMGQPRDFWALLDALENEEVPLSEDWFGNPAFCEVYAHVLERFGGKYVQIAARLRNSQLPIEDELQSENDKQPEKESAIRRDSDPLVDQKMVDMVDQFAKIGTKVTLDQPKILGSAIAKNDKLSSHTVGSSQLEERLLKLALWGSPRSGKTWFMHALAYSIGRPLHEDYSYDLFQLSPYGAERRLPLIELPSPGEKPGSNDVVWQFNWRRNPDGKKGPNHLINLHDISGKDALSRDDHALIALRESHYVLFFLDYQENENSLNSTLRLMKELLGQSNLSQHLAVCLSKADQIPPSEMKRGAEDLIQNRYGKNPLENLKVNYNKRLNFFMISSVGWLIDQKKPVANFDPQREYLIDPKQWEPENIRSPFFWLMAHEEKKLARTLLPKSGAKKNEPGPYSFSSSLEPQK